MTIFNTVPNLSYLTHRRLDHLAAAARAHWGEALIEVREVESDGLMVRYTFAVDTGITALEVQLFMDVHDNGALSESGDH